MTAIDNKFLILDTIVDPVNSTISTSGEVKQLDYKVMALLCCLAKTKGQVISRDDILNEVWPKQVIADDVLNVTISTLRKQLGDTAKNPKYIKTISRKGYQLLPEVKPLTLSEPKSSTNQTVNIVSVLLLVVMLGVIWFKPWNTPLPEKNDVSHLKAQTMAVLPFDYYASDKTKEYIADGLTEAIIHQLVQNNDLRVTSRTSVMSFKNQPKNIKNISEQLDVQWILEGSVQVEEESLSITAQLIDASSDKHIWSQTYQKPLGDLFEIQLSIANEIAKKLKVTQSEGVKKEVNVPSEAYDAYIKGRYFSLNGDKNLARESFQKAIEIYPEYALVYAELAHLEFLAAYSTKEDVVPILEKASQYVKFANELNPNLAVVQLVNGIYYNYVKNDYDKAGFWYKKAYTSDNQDIMIQEWYAAHLIITKQFNVGLSLTEHMVAVNPLAYNKMTRFLMLYYSKNYQGALNELDNKGSLMASVNALPGFYTWIYLASSNRKKLVDYAEGYLSPYGFNQMEIEIYKQKLLDEGIDKALLSVKDKLLPQLSVYNQAEILSWAGLHEDAIEILKPEVFSRQFINSNFGVEPAFEELHQYEEFQKLLEFMKLQGY